MSVTENTITRFYPQEDIQQILNIAIARQADGGELSRDHLVEIAAELGISLDNLHKAEQEWFLQKEERRNRQEFDIYRRRKLHQRVGKYIIVNSFLITINLISAGQLSWALYILLFWGLGLGLTTWNTYQLHGDEYEQAFQKWYRKQQISQLTQSIFTRLNKWLNAVS
ncbi:MULTISPECIES: 2TM domain-containing protein [unclassified Coleofasciculus]|uniref:2TM domain-containing protein n=1 Tax=unclassified Coleofasciculus TaxID=2692782 RepID=UPI0018800E92|nr:MULTISPECIES: 2TM domain-containing protein [unclassified Coleofasciculus]MBE9129311.1 2TM domain-containing protein [Coleofasciculus sp. LEGE 07081]MBE9151968.1 2TM domain-containing protein [Coleofasciculus sp. LEGE 07092]